jgi:hypothetical protein
MRNWLVMMKLASTCPNSDMGVIWGLLCLHSNTIKSSYYIQIYPVSECYLRKIPVERRGKYPEPCRFSGEGHLTVLETGIFRK